MMIAAEKRPLLIWALCCLLAGGTFLAYAVASLAAGRGEFVLPLDDVYIHFQYAKQLANGQAYVYNPGLPATSGATSFLYPFVLAFGYLLGFQGLNLGLWAMIVGALALLGALWLVYKIAQALDVPDWLALLTALIFGLTGAINWHFMSGMETGLMILFTLATLYAVITNQFRGFIVSASLLALTRPEGGVLALIAVAIMFVVGAHGAVYLHGKRRLWLFIPVLMLAVQPLVNLLVTGSAVATGNAAKSLFGMIPFYWDVVLSRIGANFARMWAEFATGVSPREGLYLPWLVGPLAFMALLVSLIRRDRWHVSLLVILWLLAGTAAIATLDTAFWHFKRYQMPLLALFFPLAAWMITRLLVRASHDSPLRYLAYGSVGIGLLVALTTSAAFLHHFALNVNYVTLQPLQMARWLQTNTPEDALTAVHDVGMMRYIGGRTTLDMVGLTTPGAAAYWRNGPGSIAEFLIQERPDYIAAYGVGHGLGLGMIAQTSIYGEPLVEYPVVLDDHFNVALAADFQGIYKPKWESVPLTRTYSVSIMDDSVLIYYLASSFGQQPADMPDIPVNVGNLASELDHNYGWKSNQDVAGFSTEVHEFIYANCLLRFGGDCIVVDAGRRISGEESFTFDVVPNLDALLISRLHPVNRGTLDIYVDGELIGTRWIPETPGHWTDVPTLIPGDKIKNTRVEIRIVPNMTEGFYWPYLHRIFQGTFEPSPVWSNRSPNASFQNGSISAAIRYQVLKFPTGILDLVVGIDWLTDGTATGDYKYFVHLYDVISQPPVAQAEKRPGGGSLPPGNWLPGVIPDTIMVDLSNVTPGTYQLAIGFYNPYSGERLMPESDVYEVSPDGRLWLGEVEVPTSN